LWLILPFGAAVALLLLSRLPDEKMGKIVRDAALGFVVFLLVGGSHLLLLRLLSPESLKIWLGTYFQGAAATRVGGAGYDPNMWYKPWWFYFGSLFKVKEAAYGSQAYPALALLMACGVLPFLETARSLEVALSALASIVLAE